MFKLNFLPILFSLNLPSSATDGGDILGNLKTVTNGVFSFLFGTILVGIVLKGAFIVLVLFILFKLFTSFSRKKRDREFRKQMQQTVMMQSASRPQSSGQLHNF